MNTTDSGRRAEAIVAENLKSMGHKIVAMNWRTKYCEIDIVSTYRKCVFFTEVKYRQTDTGGEGFDYITKKKIKQMKFAAEMWLHDNNWKNEAQLQAASVSGDFEIDIIEL